MVAELLSLPPISMLTPLQLVEESSTRPSSCAQVDHEEKLIYRITELTAARLPRVYVNLGCEARQRSRIHQWYIVNVVRS